MAPVVADAQASVSEPVTASAPAMAAAHGEPLAPPVATAIQILRGRGARISATEPPKDASPPLAPAPGFVTALPAEAPVARSAPLVPSAVTPREHAPVGSTTRPAPPVAAAPKPSAAPRLAALPPAQEAPSAPAVVSDAPQILVLRGGLRRATSVRPRRVAAAPAPDMVAQEAPSVVAPRISVLRGGAAFRSAHTALLPPVKQPAIAVVRGARSPGLAGPARPGPLVLRIRD
jgi:DNA polymerase-3 subunit gamma/tau